MKRLFLSFVALALLAGSIAACGQKGPLYLPDDEKPRKNTAKTATVSERAPMDTFSYRDGELFAEGVALSASPSVSARPPTSIPAHTSRPSTAPMPMPSPACRIWSASRSRPTPTSGC